MIQYIADAFTDTLVMPDLIGHCFLLHPAAARRTKRLKTRNKIIGVFIFHQ